MAEGHAGETEPEGVLSAPDARAATDRWKAEVERDGAESRGEDGFRGGESLFERAGPDPEKPLEYDALRDRRAGVEVVSEVHEGGGFGGGLSGRGPRPRRAGCSVRPIRPARRGREEREADGEAPGGAVSDEFGQRPAGDAAAEESVERTEPGRENAVLRRFPPEIGRAPEGSGDLRGKEGAKGLERSGFGHGRKVGVSLA